jgi:TolB-like protein/Tfp pilus assembly protein PilF
VLPFVNMSPDPENEYFGDGLAEELINALTQLKGLHVAARTSAFTFRGRETDIREIGKKLDVSTVLEGSVRKAGNRLRITAQLINIADGYHLWSERYDREMDNIFAIQDEITTAIVEQLKVELVGKQKETIVKRFTENLEAYDLYLKGIYYWNKLTPDGFERSSECFEKAIEKDPHYALAYAGLADSYWMSSIWGNLPPRQTYPKAREAVKKALEIDDTLGEAHASLACIHTFYDWDWEAAEREFKRAIELAPGSSYTRVYYSFYLNLMRRYDEAVIQARKAQELDPISSCNAHLGHRLWQARRYDEAIEEFQKWLVIEPNDWFAHHHLGELYMAKSMIKEAIAEIDKSVELSGGVPLNIALAVMAHYRFGDKEVAERLFDSLKKRASHEYIQPMCFIIIYLTRGEMNQVFEWVKKASEERDSFLPWHRVTPVDCMHFPSDPRIDELLDRLGLP